MAGCFRRNLRSVGDRKTDQINSRLVRGWNDMRSNHIAAHNPVELEKLSIESYREIQYECACSLNYSYHMEKSKIMEGICLFIYSNLRELVSLLLSRSTSYPGKHRVNIQHQHLPLLPQLRAHYCGNLALIIPASSDLLELRLNRLQSYFC